MTAKYTPISETLARELVDFLRPFQAHPDGEQARQLLRTLGEAMAIAGEYREHVELLGAELVELVARATGRQISTTLTRQTLEQCAAALESTVPVLGGAVIELPRVPERGSQRAVEAAATRALLDMPGPIDLRAFVIRPDGETVRELAPVPVWAVPERYTLWCSFRVVDVESTPGRAVLTLLDGSAEGEPF